MHIELHSVVKCPECGAFQMEEMPEEALVLAWECPGCGRVIRAAEGACCIYCSWGSVRCPRAQRLARHGSPLPPGALGDAAPYKDPRP